MQFNDDQLEIIENSGGLEYTPQRIAIVLGLDPLDLNRFIEIFNDKGSVVRQKYEHGKAFAQFEVENSLMQQMRTGDVETVEYVEKQNHFKRMERMKNELFGIEQK
ncbi:MAG: hypothetical protein JEY96_01550 [Bacteroidales bacterium]|nr:hypothetical protein [Bacteroidales bacterium]